VTVLILGSRGWLGGRYVRFCRAQGLTVADADLDICNVERLRQACAVVKPDLVINAAGHTHSADIPSIDACIATPKAISQTAQANAVGAGIVAMVCEETGAKLVHLASGCIFTGSSQVFYEDDHPNPVSWYAQTKVLGDKLVRNINPTALILRIRMPISGEPHPRNLVTKLAHASQIVDVLNSVTVVENLLDWTLQLVQQGVCGVVHAVHPQPLRYRTLMAWYQQIVDRQQSNTWIQPDDYVTTDGRSNCVLGTRTLPIELEDTEPAVKRALHVYAQAIQERAA